MDTLRARMDPGEYAALAEAVHEAFGLLAQGGESIIGGDGGLFYAEMEREFPTVLAMMLTCTMDHQIVEVPASNGASGLIPMNPEETDDPARVQAVRDFIDQWTAEREAMNAELDGIARASSPSPDD
ncbi:hypothetical protein [Streptomyces longwoodensis]|uniref:hypothetical protein n=1 Tax=Streptomyces longwoodensis TaxID=68231 RepID=UPI0033D0352E